jgi:putative peptidoglycan lipid II flippase
MGLVVSLWAKGLKPFLGSSTFGSILILITGTALGAIVFAGATKVMRMEEFDQTLGMVQKRLHR